MTALVVLMNNKAIAVAADRAVTISDAQGARRVRDGVRKLFELAPGKPISLMIYNNAEIMGNAWEPIILKYARETAGKHFGTVSDYAEDFFRFLEGSRELFPETIQRKFFMDHLSLYYAVVRHEFDHVLAQAAKGGPGPKSPVEALAIAAGRVHNQLSLNDDDTPLPSLRGFDESFAKGLSQAYRDEINTLIARFFADLKPDRQTVDKLWQIATLSVTADFFPQGLDFTGLVFAGYGAKQIYPELAAYEAQGVFLNRLRRRQSVARSISTEDPVVVQPFAQDRMLRTMLFGLDPALPQYLLGELSALIEGTRDNLLQGVGSLSAQAKRDIEDFLSDEYIVDMWHIFLDRLRDHVYSQYTHPIFASVAALPKAHLADAADNMVRITAFQQDVSGAMPTVGGGVDVATLTSEGFDWVKRADAKPKP